MRSKGRLAGSLRGGRLCRHAGAAGGVEFVAADDDVELEDEEFLEGEVAAGGVFGVLRFGEVDGADGGDAGGAGEAAVSAKGREEIGDGFVVEFFEDGVDGLAEGSLGEAVAERVDGGDAARGGWRSRRARVSSMISYSGWSMTRRWPLSSWFCRRRRVPDRRR